MKKRYDIKNLDCANCALKIEAEYRKLDGISSVKVDFAREKVYLEGNISNYKVTDLERIAQKIENQVKISEEHNHHQEGEQHNIQELILNLLGIILLIITYLFDHEIITTVNPYVIIFLYVISYVLIGGKIIYNAGKNILHGKIFDENFLMTLATLGAFAINQYVEAIAVMLFYRIGEFFQDLSIHKSRKNIKALMNIKPDIAHLLEGDKQIDIFPEELLVNQVVVVKPGERIPADGIIQIGCSSIDSSSLTGESLPKDVIPGDTVLSGSINLSGLLRVKVTQVYQDSTVARILEFVENNSNKKAQSEKFITRFAKYYTPIVVFLALFLAFVIPGIISLLTESTYIDEFNIYFKRALIFLVISCPCALVLSIPLSFFAGIGASSKAGILIKSGSDLESFSTINHFIFDKTGTLTKGSFEVTSVVSSNEALCIEYAAYAEAHSNHPIAKSIVNAYSKEIDKSLVSDIEEVFGKGIKVRYKNVELLVGNQKLLSDYDIMHEKINEVGTIIYVVANHEFIGYLVIKDQIKKSSKKAIQDLLKLNKKISIVTGDNEQTANDVASFLGIHSVYSNQLPEDKAKIIEDLVKNEKVSFIGDGVNDAPVLSIATLGIAMGGLGSDAAIEAADAVIMNDDPSQIITAYHISKKTLSIVKQNIILALGIKGIVLVLGTLGFANMWLAIFADVGVSLLAVMNAMRIFKQRIKKPEMNVNL